MFIFIGKIILAFFRRRKRCSFRYNKFSPNQTISFESTYILWKSCFSNSFVITFWQLDMALLATLVQDFGLLVRDVAKKEVGGVIRAVFIST